VLFKEIGNRAICIWPSVHHLPRTTTQPARNALAIIAQEQGDSSAAETQYQLALALFQQVGDRHAETMVHGNLGVIAYNQGNPTLARQCYERSLHLARMTDDRYFSSLCRAR
jgi:Tfp pilus assembly protein PilF